MKWSGCTIAAPGVPARVQKPPGADGEELYRNPGLTDLTCDVNFTDLLELSRNCLEDRVTFMTQRDYLLPMRKTRRRMPF